MSWVTEHISDDPEVLGDFLEALVDLHYAGDWGKAAKSVRQHEHDDAIRDRVLREEEH